MKEQAKTPILRFLLNMIFLVVFNVIFFWVGGTDHPISVWVSYGTIHLAYLFLVFAPVLTPRCDRSDILVSSVQFVSLIYFLVELVVGVIFILIASETYMAAVLVQMILFAVYAFVLLYVMIANKATAASMNRQKAEVAYIKMASARVKFLIDRTQDKQANRAVEGVYDLLHSSPTQSAAAVKPLEMAIFDKIGELEAAVRANEIATVLRLTKEITDLTEERNMKLRFAF